jgi:hypothetical protein
MVNAPAAFVRVPPVCPFATTDAPSSGVPASLVTTPVMVLFCEKASTCRKSKVIPRRQVNNNRFLIITAVLRFVIEF